MRTEYFHPVGDYLDGPIILRNCSLCPTGQEADESVIASFRRACRRRPGGPERTVAERRHRMRAGALPFTRSNLRHSASGLTGIECRRQCILENRTGTMIQAKEKRDARS
jgi:hypothetical protein